MDDDARQDTSDGAARIRAATASDATFLRQMLAVAADWRPGALRPVDQVLADPALAHYVVGWPREDDFGVVAEDDAGRPVGAAWCRRFPADDPGYGFVAPDVPELAIAVVEGARGRQVGRQLLEHLRAEARERAVDRVSLSVERDNPAVRLYASVGFVTVGEHDGSLTMVLDTA